MKSLLFINACVRGDSRTNFLANEYLKKHSGEFEIKEVVLKDLDIKPLLERDIIKRDESVSAGDFKDYSLAKDFADADEILVAAPFWDLSFPSILKVYFENIAVNSVTFAYSQNGELIKLCKAEKLTYIATSGGFIGENSSLKAYIAEITNLFGIKNVDFYFAEGLDIFTDRVEKTLKNTIEKM